MFRLSVCILYIMVGVVTILPLETLCNKKMNSLAKFIHIVYWPTTAAIKHFEGNVCADEYFSRK